MRTRYFPSCQCIQGFALVELMVVTVVIGLLALVATPTLISYRDKSRVASALGTANTIQGALAAYTTTNANYLYPETITSYGDLLTIVNANGATLKSSEADMGLLFQTYHAIDSGGNGEYETYTMKLRVMGVATRHPGWCIVIQPSGVEKCAAL